MIIKKLLISAQLTKAVLDEVRVPHNDRMPGLRGLMHIIKSF